MVSILIKQGWWRSVTPIDLRESTDVVQAFFNQEGEASAYEIESFARALALCQLFINPEAVMNAADSASKLIRPSECVRDAKDARNWLARNQALIDGLNRCLVLLETHQDSKWRPAVEHALMKVLIYKQNLLRSAESDEAHTKVLTETMIKEKLETASFRKRKL